jgi:hypothetical protein
MRVLAHDLEGCRYRLAIPEAVIWYDCRCARNGILLFGELGLRANLKNGVGAFGEVTAVSTRQVRL